MRLPLVTSHARTVTVSAALTQPVIWTPAVEASAFGTPRLTGLPSATPATVMVRSWQVMPAPLRSKLSEAVALRCFVIVVPPEPIVAGPPGPCSTNSDSRIELIPTVRAAGFMLS